MMSQRFAAGVLVTLLPSRVLAAPIDPAGFLGEFFNKASRLTDDLIGVSTELYRFSELEWTTFTVFALVIVLIKWTIGAAAVKDVIFVVLMILIAQSLLQSYDYILALLWEITTVLSDDINLNTYRALNLQATGIESTGVFLLDMINHIMERITFEPATGEIRVLYHVHQLRHQRARRDLPGYILPRTVHRLPPCPGSSRWSACGACCWARCWDRSLSRSSYSNAPARISIAGSTSCWVPWPISSSPRSTLPLPTLDHYRTVRFDHRRPVK